MTSIKEKLWGAASILFGVGMWAVAVRLIYVLFNTTDPVITSNNIFIYFISLVLLIIVFGGLILSSLITGYAAIRCGIWYYRSVV